MKKKLFFFGLAVLLSLGAATYRWGDSAHAIGLIKARGGEARHPSFMKGGGDEYTLIATATVIPPYRGDARVVLEGEPKMDYELRLSGPIIDLGLRRHPRLAGDILTNLHPLDRVALWVVMKPRPADPVCGMGYEEGFRRYAFQGKDYVFCSDYCLEAFKKDPQSFQGKGGARGRYILAFYDTKTDKKILTVPVVFTGKGERHAEEHHH